MKNEIYKIQTPWGVQYETQNLSLEEGKALVEKQEGKLLQEYQSNHAQYYLLNSGEVVSLSFPDADWYSSLDGLLADLQVSGLFIKKHIDDSFPVKKIKYGLNGEKIFYSKLSKDSDIVHQKDLNLINETFPNNIVLFQTQNGEILYRQGEFSNFLFRSINDVHIFIKRLLFDLDQTPVIVRKGLNVYPEFLGLNPYGHDILNQRELLFKELISVLHLKSTKQLDHSFKSLNWLEKQLFQNLIDAEFSSQIFLPLLFYIGEVYNKENNTKWELINDPIYNLVAIDIKNKNGILKLMSKQLMILLDSTTKDYYPIHTVYNHRQNENSNFKP